MHESHCVAFSPSQAVKPHVYDLELDPAVRYAVEMTSADTAMARGETTTVRMQGRSIESNDKGNEAPDILQLQAKTQGHLCLISALGVSLTPIWP